MASVEVLALNGSPGTGKNTVTRAISKRLVARGISCAVIDVDEIALVFLRDKPFEWKKAFMWRNLAAMWPNYASIGDIKVIIPLVIDNDTELAAFKAAIADAKLSMCELTAPVDVLKQRITEREPGNRERMFELIDRYDQRHQANAGKYADFEISTHDKGVEEVADEIMVRIGW